jgi:PIG-X / PBN1
VPSERVYLHTYTASSNPEFLAEEAEGEVVILEFQGLRVDNECVCGGGREGYGGRESRGRGGRGERSVHILESSSESESESVGDRDRDREGEREGGKDMEGEIDSNNVTLFPYHDNSNSTTTITADGYNTNKKENETDRFVVNTVITDIDFSFPIHLRYHTPHDDLLSVKNTKTVENSNFKTVIVPYPTVYLGTENCEKKSKTVFETPIVKRIYDISFLGQNGNAQSTVSNDHFYVKLSNMKNDKDLVSGDDYSNSKNNDNNNNNNNDNEDNNDRNKNKHNKSNIKSNVVKLSVPVGCYSNNFVLFATVFCYFLTSGGIVVSLLF